MKGGHYFYIRVIWCPVMAPFFGAQVGTILYDFLLYKGPDNVFGRLGSRKHISPA